MNHVQVFLVTLLMVVVCVLAGLLLSLAHTQYQLEMQDMKSEHACIGKLISKEIPRSRITADGGKCWVETNQ